MDTIEQLHTILATYTPGDPITRISVSSWMWFLLHHTAAEVCFTYTGFEADELEPPNSFDVFTLTVNNEQFEPFRLWDRDGQEVFCHFGQAEGPH